MALTVLGVGNFTYSDWQHRASEHSAELAQRDILAGSRVILCFESTDWFEYAAAFVGCLALNAIAVPISASATESELGQLRTACDPAMVITRDARQRIAYESISGPPAPGGTGRVAEPGDAIAQILYTSGTSGTPKCVAASHANLVQGMDWEPFLLDGGGAHGASFHAFPIGTNAGQVRLVEALLRGTPLVVAPVFLPSRFLRAVIANRISFATLTPTMGWLVVQHACGDVAGVPCTELPALLLTGAAAAPTLLQKLQVIFPNATLLNSYASTESWPASVTMEYDPGRPTALGQPQGLTKLSIRGADGDELPPGTVGAIWMSADGTSARSYWGAPEAENDRVFVDGWTRTGDLGYVDADGYLFITDREADTVNVRGYNVSTIEVEFAVMEHPGVLDAAALGVPDRVDGECLVVAVVLSQHVDPEELGAFVRTRLSRHKVPSHFCVVTELPRTLSGKVKKRDVFTTVLSAIDRA